jgi:hypothetical protein
MGLMILPRPLQFRGVPLVHPGLGRIQAADRITDRFPVPVGRRLEFREELLPAFVIVVG